MDVDVQPVVALHLQRRLHTRLREHSHRGVAPVDGLLKPTTNLRQTALLRHLLLRVVVARQPPRRVVASHCKLRALLLDEEVVQPLLLGELIAESDTIVVHSEADHDGARLPLLRQRGRILVIVVANVARLAPYGLPRLVERAGALARQREVAHQVVLVQPRRRVLVLGQLQSQVRGAYHVPTLIRHTIHRASVHHVERHHNVAVGRLHFRRLQSECEAHRQQPRRPCSFHFLSHVSIIMHFALGFYFSANLAIKNDISK